MGIRTALKVAEAEKGKANGKANSEAEGRSEWTEEEVQDRKGAKRERAKARAYSIWSSRLLLRLSIGSPEPVVVETQAEFSASVRAAMKRAFIVKCGGKLPPVPEFQPLEEIADGEGGGQEIEEKWVPE